PGLSERNVLDAPRGHEIDEVDSLAMPAAVRHRGQTLIGAHGEPERKIADLDLETRGREVPAVRQPHAAVAQLPGAEDARAGTTGAACRCRARGPQHGGEERDAGEQAATLERGNVEHGRESRTARRPVHATGRCSRADAVPAIPP